QRAVPLKTEASFGPVELGRTHAQIQQNAVATARFNPIRQLGEMAASQIEASGKIRQPRRGGLKRGAIAIAPKQTSSRRARFQYRCGVATPADRTVGVPAARPRAEGCQHLRHQDGFVSVSWHRAWIT